ncbi:hypothetical protein U732_769 [Clostridium argentinense CDC 2741]|uniref:Uncharacterized protein n=1 Tax=Clostridium argentinense CDC 2741 TaxID=1418104 RepID=A0A0C1TZA9_9CLOT|nr:hypothetical protein [Clostridium argentinense]ARC84235.1 hypothetical protein RSJ17_06645 [Clostridium argentinense]KIE44608.1 hypothetical protein U732_769 [Clostridium argentinense CDC 2741]NFF38191.1 hypothetical protein [Clostridium argentinense]NFP49223.1 hypothetical protein [Clostridium argentinense]NFP71497.1 hypothetical protein [Clostridium argentinense]
MVKKVTVIILILLLSINTNVFAGDIPESIMLGEQEALFIGEITNIDTNLYNIKPLTIMMGSIEKAEIQVKKFDKYYGTDDNPKIGDVIVAVLLDDNKINDTWIFKCTSEDYKTLELISEPYEMVIRYQQYINEGMYFEAQKKIDEDKKQSAAETNVSIQDRDTNQNNYKDKSIKTFLINNIFMLLSALITIIVFVIFIIYKKQHDN